MQSNNDLTTVDLATVDHPAPTKHDLLRIFTDRSAVSTPLPKERSAAVAMVFHEDAGDLKLCIGRRATVVGDPWSGDRAFPGGKPDAQDASLHDTASREAFEEVGLSLPADSLIGDMGEMRFGVDSRTLFLYPLVYMIDAPTPFQLDHELVDAQWISAAALWDRANWMLFNYGPSGQTYHGVDVMDHYLWGMSLRVLHDFSRRIERPLTPLYEGMDLPWRDGDVVASTRIG